MQGKEEFKGSSTVGDSKGYTDSSKVMPGSRRTSISVDEKENCLETLCGKISTVSL